MSEASSYARTKYVEANVHMTQQGAAQDHAKIGPTLKRSPGLILAAKNSPPGPLLVAKNGPILPKLVLACRTKFANQNRSGGPLLVAESGPPDQFG